MVRLGIEPMDKELAQPVVRVMGKSEGLLQLNILWSSHQGKAGRSFR